MAKKNFFQIAIVGCLHNCLDECFAEVKNYEISTKNKVDLVLCCGDFEALRNLYDLENMHCPDKYKNIGSFYQYYTGEKVAPYLTLVVGGNHEASNHFRELYFGGWIAQNMYYFGSSGSVIVKKGN